MVSKGSNGSKGGVLNIIGPQIFKQKIQILKKKFFWSARWGQSTNFCFAIVCNSNTRMQEYMKIRIQEYNSTLQQEYSITGD